MTATVSRQVATPKGYSPTGKIGKIANEAFKLKLEIDRLEAIYKDKMATLRDHCESLNISRIDVGDIQVQYKLRHKWEYSLGTQNEMLRIQQLQKVEQTAGIAIDNPTKYVALSLSRKGIE